jgi:dihydropyrimidinase
MMAEFDITIRNGSVASASETVQCDIGIRAGKIVCLAEKLPPGRRDIDAAGRYVVPGGIDSHCHIEQLSSMGILSADDFFTGTVAAAFGGTTTIIPFAAQHRGQSVTAVVADYHERARSKAVIDYGFHLIIADPTEKVMGEELPAALRQGITSFKVYMTYDALRLDDRQMLDILALANRESALVMVHAENHEMIKWIAERLLARGHSAPKFHGVSHDPLAESEATHRAIALSRLTGTPVLIVHVSTAEATATIRAAQTQGAPIYAETCPHYLMLTAQDMDRPGLEGAKACCSPPLRDPASQDALWRGLSNGTFQVYSSDHAPYPYDKRGKLPKGEKTTFKDVANGVPGIELRLPILFSEGVMKGRLSLNQFVALTSTNHARLYGLLPRKGTLAPGADADAVIWNPTAERTVTAAMLHEAVGYTPYEGLRLKGWPETVVSRGRVVIEDGKLLAERGSGLFVACGTPEPVLTRCAQSAAQAAFNQLVM